MPARMLPARPDLLQYKKQAKELARAVRAADAAAIARLHVHHPRFGAVQPSDPRLATFLLTDAQLVIAREHGLDSWPKLVREIERRSGPVSPARLWTLAERAAAAGDAATLERLLREHEPRLKEAAPEGSWLERLPPHFSGGDVRAMIAGYHQFPTWEAFEAFARERGKPDSAVARFEAAVDAVVGGDEGALDGLLRAHPELVHARSLRSHRSTLLLYVGANGVEDFRQRTPKNAVRIAERLLAAGAEVDAVGDMYRGTTTLGLVATSVHPVTAGVQADLIDVLVRAGASLSRAVAPDYTHGRVVNACLANGRGEGAQLVAQHGAELDVEGAAGVGHLEAVKRFFDGDGLIAGATRDQLVRGGFWAAHYGHRAVVEFLLAHGLDVNESRGHETMLHGAAHGGHPDIVRILIAGGALLDVPDDEYHATPLGWALHGWSSRRPGLAREPYYDAVRQLVAAGALARSEWLADQQIAADQALVAALGLAPDPSA